MTLDRSVDLLLMDERYRTRVARDLGLTTVGTIGIPVAAAGKGLVSLRKSFDALRATTFRGPDGLMDELLRMENAGAESLRPHHGRPGEGKGASGRSLPGIPRHFESFRDNPALICH